VQPSLVDTLNEALSLEFSAASLDDSLAVTLEALSRSALEPQLARSAIRRSGTHKLGLRTLFYSAFVSYGLFPPQARADQDWLSTLDEISRTCKDYALECTFFLSPMSANILYGYHYFALWPELEHLIFILARSGRAYSFLWFNTLTAEPLDAERSHWVDSIHFDSHIGDLMMHALTGSARERDASGRYFAELNPASVTSVLRELQTERDEWEKARPDVLWGYRQLAESLAGAASPNSVSFERGALHITIGGNEWVQNNAPRSGGDIVGGAYDPVTQNGAMSGFAMDTERGTPADAVALVFRGKVISWQKPWFDASDGNRVTSRSGFHFEYHVAAPPNVGEKILVFGLFGGGEALEIGPPGGVSLDQ
jgi:hypothetical protein